MAPENNLSLGEFLRQERERRGITIEQVASATKISVKLLHSLETDNFADLPAKPFIRGFVISYSRFIGLDAKATLSQFNDFIERKSKDRPSREEGHSGYAFEKRETEQSRTVLWAVMGGFVVLGGFVIFFLKPSLRHHRPSHIEKLRAVHTEVAMSVPSPAPSALPSSLSSNSPMVMTIVEKSASPTATPSPRESRVSETVPSPKPNSSPSPEVAKQNPPNPKEPPDLLNSGRNLALKEIKYKIVFKALERVWVRYQVDERPIMKFVLAKDKVLVLRAKSKVRFQTSNPNVVEFSYNGKAFKPFSEAKSAVMRQNSLSLILPSEDTDIIEEPFPGEKALPIIEIPSPTPSVSLSTPSV